MVVLVSSAMYGSSVVHTKTVHRPVAFCLELLYRKAVPSHSPGLPLRLPWGTELNGRFNRNAVASIGATRSGLIMICTYYPRLKQPWAVRRNRFAVAVRPPCLSKLHLRLESTISHF